MNKGRASTELPSILDSGHVIHRGKPVLDLRPALGGLIGYEEVVSSRLMQRGMADLVEGMACDALVSYFQGNPKISIARSESKRSIEDLSITTCAWSILVDIKSRDIDADFSMPNLISIKRLRSLYQSPDHTLCYIFVDYRKVGGSMVITGIKQASIDELHPDCMHIQNLGMGQLQLRRGDTVLCRLGCGREEFMHDMSDMAVRFYARQIDKLKREQNSWSE